MIKGLVLCLMGIACTESSFYGGANGNFVSGNFNKLPFGNNNKIFGDYNGLVGNNNKIFGDYNGLAGNNNFLVSSNSNVMGNGNWITGNGVNFQGNGLKMFGPQSNRMFW